MKRLVVLVRHFLWLATLATVFAPVSPIGHWHAAMSTAGVDASAPLALSYWNNLVGANGGEVTSPDGVVHVSVPAKAVDKDTYLQLSSQTGEGDDTALGFTIELVAPGEKTATSGFQAPASVDLSLPRDVLARFGEDLAQFVVKRMDPSTTDWTAIGGAVDASKGSVSLSTDLTGSFIVARQTPVLKTATASITSADGGALAASDGVQLSFMPGTTPEDLRVEYKADSKSDFRPSSQRVVREFQLNAYAVNRADAVVSTFDKPIQITVTHTPDQIRGLRTDVLRLFSWDEGGKGWIEVPDQTVTPDGTIAAPLTHFSVYSTQTSDEIAGPGQNLYHQVDMHSGAATVSYPIELPAGPGGFKPSPLSLSYSSSTVNEMKSLKALGSWVGTGWDISIPAVVYDPITTKYFLSLDGTYNEMVATGGGQYKTKSDRYMRILSNNLSANGSTPGTVEVTDTRGIKYLFGGQSLGSSSELFQRYYYKPEQIVYYRLDLARVIDTNLNYADYQYFRDTGGPAATCPNGWTGQTPCRNVRAAYLARVYWGDTNPDDGHWDMRFRVNIAEPSTGNGGLDWDLTDSTFGNIRRDDPYCLSPVSAPAVMETRRLRDLKVETIDSLNNWHVSRRYTFDYDNTDTGCIQSGRLTLSHFKQFGKENSATPLFDMSFGYVVGLYIRTKYSESGTGHSTGDVCWWNTWWPFLGTVNNGYGGQTNFYYEEQWQAAQNIGCPWARQVVTTKTESGSYGNAVAKTYQYTDGPKYYLAPGGFENDAEFRGFRKVSEIDANNDYMKCHYYTTGFEPDTGFMGDNITGNWFRCEWYDASQAAVIKYIDPTWLSAATAPGVNFVYKAWEWAVADSQALNTWYSYDNYGNLFSKQERGPEWRWTNMTYFPNTSSWIVSLPAVQVIKTASTVFSTQTWHYDNETPAANGSDYGTPPVKGNLTGKWGWEGYSNGVPTTPHRKELLKYDSLSGNMIEQTEYRDNASVLTTSYAYDSLYRSFLSSESFTVGGTNQTTSYGYDFVLGLRTSITDPNLQTYNKEYDEYGRLTKEWDPGDSPNFPTRQYIYEWDATPPNLTWKRQLETSGTSADLESSTLYDGLGRPVQERAEIASGSTCKASVTDTIYDAVGREQARSLPYESSVTGPGCRVADYTLPAASQWTSKIYDAIGRPNRITQPSPSSDPNLATAYTSLTYSGYTETRIDENFHKTDTVKDAYGRTVSVNEYTGSNPYTLYATSSYQYDVLDHQTRITDAATNQTSMTYDSLGFQRQLDDPDTGLSTYTYYDDGLVKTHTDARNETVTVNYDGLGRVTSNSYSGPIPAPTLIYTYDTCQLLSCPDSFSRGHLTKVTDGSQTELYKYDYRGRLSVKQTTIDGVNYVVSHAYDSMNREVSTGYPAQAPESISILYDSQGLVETVTGSSSYLSSTDYNASGQLTRLTFGNTGTPKTQDFTYFPDGRVQTLSISATNPATTYQYTYDAKGNMQTITDNSLPAGVPATTTFGYDERDRLTSVSGPTSASFGYDAIGNMTRKDEGAIQGAARETAAQCQNGLDDDGDGKINDGCTTTYPNASALSYACSPACSPPRPHAVKSAAGNNPNFTYDNTFTANYSYDEIGNVKEINSAPSDPELGLLLRNHKTGEGYDAEGRLWKIEYNKLDDASDFAFYDLNGDCQINSTDENLLHQGPSWNKSVGQTGYSSLYDLNSNGSVFQDDLTLLQSEMNKSCPTFTYDPDGQLVKLDGPKRVVYIDGIFEQNLGTGEVTKYYAAGDRRVAMRTGTAVRYLADDHLGSTAFIMNASGGLDSQLRYHPYGMTWSQSAAPATDKLFTGHQQMGAKSGTYYANARFYSADVGRFPQPDSVMSDSLNPQALSRYSYVENNPTNRVDPTGHDYMPAFPFPGCGLGSNDCGGGGAGGGVSRTSPPNLVDIKLQPAVDSQPVIVCSVGTDIEKTSGPILKWAKYNWYAKVDCHGEYLWFVTFRAALFGWDGLGTLNREAETVCLGTAPCVIAKTGRKGVRLKVGTYYSISACLPYEVPILGPRGTEISFAVYGRCGLGAIYLSNSGERSWVIGLRPGGS